MALLALLAPASGLAPPPPPGARNQQAAPAAAEGRALAPEQLLLLTVVLDRMTLSEGLSAFGGDGDAYYLPIGELGRLLDLDIRVDLKGGKVSGRLGEAERALTIDLEQGFARTGGQNLQIPADAWGRTSSDVFLRADLLAQLLPVQFKLDVETLELTLTATETLPVQARAERERRIDGLSRPVGGQLPVMRVPAAYALARIPSVEFALESGYDNRTRLFGRRYDVRAAGDLLGSAFSAYLGSDQVGAPSTARVKLERKSAEGRLLGPLRATYAGIGDVYTPGLTLGPASATGRGISLSTAPLNGTEIFQKITLRGELPLGYQVELYINDILRSGQRTPVDGRYEFIDIPLTRGLNVVRVVLYGPQGERSEDVRVLNVGGGQLPRGRVTLDAGVSEQGRDAIPLNEGEIAGTDAGRGRLRGVVSIGYGLSTGTTLRAGAASFADARGIRRSLASAGIRTSVLGLATSLDYAQDLDGGSAAALAFAGEPFGLSLSGRHAEYRGGFVDENSRFGSPTRRLVRDTTADINLALPIGSRGSVPVSLRADRVEFIDGVDWIGSARGSSVVADTLVSVGLDYRHDGTRVGTSPDRLTGNLSLSRLVGFAWQVRASLDFDVLPSSSVRAFALTADRAVSDKLALRFGAGRSFGRSASSQVQTSAAWRLPFGDVALTGDWAIERREYRIGLRLSFGLARDPWSGRVRVTRPGIAAGGSAALHAFLDRNGNGRHDAGEAPMPGVVVTGGERSVTTDAEGRAWIMGLGEGPSARLHANSANIDAFFVESPPQDIELSPRAGTVLAVAYPFAPVSEVLAKIVTRDVSGRDVGLSAVRVQLAAEGKPPIAGTTQFDGTVIFEGVPPGAYRLVLDPEQAGRLGMELLEIPELTVRDDGVPPEVEAQVRFRERR